MHIFCSILSLLILSFSSFLLQCLPFCVIALDVKPLLAFETSSGRSRTKPETEELCECGRQDSSAGKKNEGQDSPTEPTLHMDPTGP